MSDWSAGFLWGLALCFAVVALAFVVELFRDKNQGQQMSEAWKREAWRHHDLK